MAIIIGTAAVISIIGLGSSASKSLDERIDDLGGRTLYVGPSQRRSGAVTQGLNPLVLKDAEALAKDNEHSYAHYLLLTLRHLLELKGLILVLLHHFVFDLDQHTRFFHQDRLFFHQEILMR